MSKRAGYVVLCRRTGEQRGWLCCGVPPSAGSTGTCRQYSHLGELYGTLEPVAWPPNAAANVLFARRYAATTLLDFVAWLLVIL